ncbi:hypothetical protein HXA34_16020 [Salipaludibacillus agaradhaerens]|uniref:DUF6612 family protein n=1 Tax=Salipaludibacillus agaradhaerens TaxID=76935 RepID=UPI002150BF9D|nr:DUF6612 family protein [Salipaludibacillus agaradhaerens]MCR6107813.1 hypothetical protein [Salipaludibacillus agaradhaerens]MCR6119842.1 hypothetical protein [Salipaludibacillus agaradhaerens]
MKKSILTSLSAVTLLSLAACGDTASVDGISVEEILKESISTMEELDSYALAMDMAQTIEGELELMSFDYTYDISLTLEPTTMEMIIRADMGELGNGEYLVYLTEDDGFYIKEPTATGWMKRSDDFSDGLMTMTEIQRSPANLLKSFKDNMQHLSIETNDSSYIISLDSDDLDKADILDHLEDLGFDDMAPFNGADMNIENISHKVTIDKETFYQTDIDIEMTFNMMIMEENTSIDQQLHLMLSDFNNIEPIQIPKDVLEEAANELDF